MGLGWKEKDIQQALQVLIPDKDFFFQPGTYVLPIYSNINSGRAIKTWMLAPKSFPIRYSVHRLYQGKSFPFDSASQRKHTKAGHFPDGYTSARKHCCLKITSFKFNGPK